MPSGGFSNAKSGMNPRNIAAIHRILASEYRRHEAPVVELEKARGNSPFRILVAAALSARTRDETTSAACSRLFARAGTPAKLASLDTREIERLIFPVGFYRTKARHMKRLAEQLISRHRGRVPDSLEELVRLPGVGRKTANLVLIAAFDKPAICVDVHVHRISNRLGLVRTRSPIETETALRRILPPKYWKTWNSYLVSFGQRICLPLRPRCRECPLARFCARRGVRQTGILRLRNASAA